MKYLKKVSASQLISSQGTIIDSMNPGDDQTVNAPSIHAVKDYVENANTLTLTLSGSNSFGQGSFYEKNGVVHINGSCAYSSSTSTVNWNDIGTVPEGYRPASDQWYPAIGMTVSGSTVSGFYPALLRISTGGLVTMMCKTAVGSCIFDAQWKI